LGSQIRGELWYVSSDQISRRLVRKRYFSHEKLLELWFQPEQSEEEIRDKVLSEIQRISKVPPIKGRYVDLECYLNASPLIRWGLHHAQEVNRAHILAALDRKVPESQIMDVLGVGRTAIWRTRKAYLEGGLEFALRDEARPGKPRRYEADVEAQISALACSAPPPGARRWTLVLLEQAARAQPAMRDISRETIRRLLKKTSSSPGAA
jgi:transposase